ncbi:hypothetical protein H4219_004843 [Mycoemilia scoparia]|uniref:Uncharacterized protein n=1 Tax=Mycoemilia scoparia TaxID=417184 RepID=A0A9W7ZQ89_9FUNG|nr:hypothetical protein H4219_004843 [Mycoemilia scoparia]
MPFDISTLTGYGRAVLYLSTRHLKDRLFRVLLHVCHCNATGLISELADKLNSINPSSNQKENTKINEWALGIKQAAQALIDQAKELNPGNGLFKGDQSASGTDHDRVLCIWKLCFATYISKNLYEYLEKLKTPVDGVTTDDCFNMFGQINDIANPILGTIGVDNLNDIYKIVLSNGANVDYPEHVVQKIHECIASEPVDITDSVKAITFDVDGKVVNLEDHINNLVGLFCPMGESQPNTSLLLPQ